MKIEDEIIKKLGLQGVHYIYYCPDCGTKLDCMVVKVKELKRFIKGAQRR